MTRVGTRWRSLGSTVKSGKAIQEHLLKRKHPISSLSSTKGDQETERVILRKKPGHRLTLDCSDSSDPIPIRPNRILAETPFTTNETTIAVKRQEHLPLQAKFT